MYHPSEDELWPDACAATVRRRLVEQRQRCLKMALGLAAPGVTGVVFLCLWGLHPAALAVPVFLTAASLLAGSALAALFARLAHLDLGDVDDGSDDDDPGYGGGSTDEPEPPGGGGLEVDWDRFEREFRSYCERTKAVPA